MKYLIFEFLRFYPSGGWNDLAGTGDNLNKIYNNYLKKEFTEDVFVQVITSKNFKKVLEGNGEYNLKTRKVEWEWDFYENTTFIDKLYLRDID